MIIAIGERFVCKKLLFHSILAAAVIIVYQTLSRETQSSESAAPGELVNYPDRRSICLTLSKATKATTTIKVSPIILFDHWQYSETFADDCCSKGVGSNSNNKNTDICRSRCVAYLRQQDESYSSFISRCISDQLQSSCKKRAFSFSKLDDHAKLENEDTLGVVMRSH